MDRVSDILKKIMLVLFMLFMAAALALGVFRGFAHKSYIAAFAAALVGLGLYCLLIKKLPKDRVFLCERLGAVKTGAVIAFICLAVNLAWVLFCRFAPENDYATFWASAVDISRGEAPRYAEYLALFPHILGYSTFLSAFIRLFGEGALVAPIINVLLTTATGIIIYVLCLKWRDIKTAAFAFLLWSFLPSKMLYNAAVLSEPFYTCLIMLFILLAAEAEQRIEALGCKLPLVLLLALGGAAALCAVNAARPIAAVPIIAFFIWLLLLRGTRERSRLMWRRWAVFAIVLVAVYAALGAVWDRHAERTLGEKLPSLPGYSIYVGFNPQSNGSYSNEDMDMLMHYRYAVYGSAADAQAQMLEEAKNRILNGDISFGKLFPRKIQTFIGDDEGGAYTSKPAVGEAGFRPLAVLSNAYYYAVVLLAVAGASRLWHDKRNSCALIAPMYVLGLTLAHMLVEVSARYHYSIMPMIIIIAAYSVKEKAEG